MFEKIKNNVILLGLIGVIIILLVSIFQLKKDNKNLLNEVRSIQSEIIKGDSLRKISDGNYTKLVDNQKTQQELQKDLKNSNLELYKKIKEGNEKIQQLNQYFITFKTKLDSGLATMKDSNNYELNVFYPEKSDWFINWNGIVNKNNGKYLGNWNFGKLNFSATVTQQPNGLWRTYIHGPDFLVLDSVKIESLPPQTTLKRRNLEFLMGGGYRWNSVNNERNFVFGGGFQWKSSNILFIDVATDQSVTGKFIYKFDNFKRN